MTLKSFKPKTSSGLGHQDRVRPTFTANDLVRRQAAILIEIEHLNDAELKSLGEEPFDTPSSEEAKAQRLLVGLIRTGIVGRDARIVKSPWSPDKRTVVPAVPGLFTISLMPLSDGSFDRDRVLKEPVIAWTIDGGNYAEPIRPGLSVTDRWAVLTPEGFVVTDEYTNLFGEAPLALKDWIKSEIEWLESEAGGPVTEFPTVCRRVFEYGGPLAKALGLMMAGRHDWIGTVEEMFETLAKFRDGVSEGWPAGPGALAAALTELNPKLADADLFFAPVNDGRLFVTRHTHSTARGGSHEQI
ncbi:hypothetical protein [Mesorhizobium sp. M0254]|uniref:hypothetical protein n=1 Tax=Mesorhizobium sp. M0254 TaxID=2956927 RepID=UPI00333684E2